MRTRAVSPKTFTRTLLRSRIREFNALNQGKVSWGHNPKPDKNRAYYISGWNNTWSGLSCKEACEIVNGMIMLTKTGQMNINQAEMKIQSLKAQNETLTREVSSLRGIIEENTTFVIHRSTGEKVVQKQAQQDLPEYDDLLDETDTLKRRITALQKDLDEILEIEEQSSKELEVTKREIKPLKATITRQKNALKEALISLGHAVNEVEANNADLELLLSRGKMVAALQDEVKQLRKVAERVKKTRTVADAVIGTESPETDMTKNELFVSLANDINTLYDWVKYIYNSDFVMKRHESLFKALCNHLETHKRLSEADIKLTLTVISDSYFGVLV
jgi:hypothetical protein